MADDLLGQPAAQNLDHVAGDLAPRRRAWRHLVRDPAAWISGSVIVVIVLLAIAAPLISHFTGHSPTSPNFEGGTDSYGQPLPPFTNGFLLGTDNQGRDILVRIAFGAQASLVVGVVASLLATVLGVTVGLICGYFRGVTDAFLSRLTDMVLSFPYLLVALALVAVFGSSLAIAIFVIAGFSWGPVARIVRGLTLSQREKQYVSASRSIGSRRIRVMFVEILPNLISPIIVLATLLIPLAIVLEASLSFLGLGVTPPSPSWGNMLADAEQVAGYQAWWFWLFPSLALVMTTLAFNVFGDSLRDALDPDTDRLFARRR